MTEATVTPAEAPGEFIAEKMNRFVDNLTEPCPFCVERERAAAVIDGLASRLKLRAIVQGPQGEGYPRVEGDLIPAVTWNCGQCGNTGWRPTAWGRRVLEFVRLYTPLMPPPEKARRGEIPF